MTSTNRPPLPYLINVPEDQVTALNKFMKERRIQFSPMENLLVINGGSPDTPVFHGDQIPDLIAEINGHLEGDHDISPAVPENCREWSLDTCREFLELAHTGLLGATQRPDPTGPDRRRSQQGTWSRRPRHQPGRLAGELPGMEPGYLPGVPRQP